VLFVQQNSLDHSLYYILRSQIFHGLKSDRAIWNLDLRLLKFQSWQRCTSLLHEAFGSRGQLIMQQRKERSEMQYYLGLAEYSYGWYSLFAGLKLWTGLGTWGEGGAMCPVHAVVHSVIQRRSRWV